MKKLLLSISVFALFSTAFFAFGTQHAAAATWCGVMANPTRPNGTTSANCINGQNYTALNGLGSPGTSSATLKTNFRNYINSKSSSGYGFQKIGAAFIKNGLDGGTGTWSTRINNPAVTFRMETFNSCGTAWPNTAFSIKTNKVVNDPNCKVATPALVIRLNGTVVYAIKVDCGNPMGNLIVLPSYDWTLTGTSTVSSATAKRSATVTFKHTVKNSGPSTAAYSWRIEKRYATASWSYLTSSAAVTTAVGGKNPNAKAYAITIPSTATNGSVYCQRIQYTNSNGPAGTTAYSSQACVTVSVVVFAGCPNLGGAFNQAAVGVSLPTNEPSPTYPNTTTMVTRTVTGRTIISATDANRGTSLPFNNAAKTVDFRPAVTAYPYDSQLASVKYTNTYNTAVYTWKVIGSHYNYNPVTKKWDILVKDYGWVLTSSGSGSTSVLHTDGSASMGECFRRNFVVTDVSTGSINFNDVEDPTSASAGGSTVSVTFDYEGPDPTVGMRNRMQVRLNYTYQYVNGCNSGGSGSGSFMLTGGFSAGAATGTIPNSGCSTSATLFLPGDTLCISYHVSPEQGQMTSSGSPIGGSGSVDSESTCVNVVDKPYVHFFGLDVSAGGKFANGDDKCLSGAPPVNGGISTSIKPLGPLARGSAVQYGALALGTVSGFGSASLRTSTPNFQNGLTFANTPSLGALGSKNCVPDYYGTKPASLMKVPGNVNLPSFNSFQPTPTVSQIWHGQATGTIINGFNGDGSGIANNNRVAVYIEGNAYIDKDIVFKDTVWSNMDEVPSFYLVASGNIYISPNVTELDGVYVAKGAIYTCAKNFGIYPPNELVNNCSDQLVVNGAFIAQQVFLHRTFGSLRNSLGGESPLTFGGDCTLNTRLGQRVDKSYDCAAEVFNFSPETFLGKPALGPTPGSTITKYDFITSLSPVL